MLGLARVCVARERAMGPEPSGLVRTSPAEAGLFSSVLLVICASWDLNFQVGRPQGGPGLHSLATSSSTLARMTVTQPASPDITLTIPVSLLLSSCPSYPRCLSGPVSRLRQKEWRQYQDDLSRVFAAGDEGSSASAPEHR